MRSLFRKKKEEAYQRKSLGHAFILIVFVLLILIVSTAWLMGSSQKATEASVHNVSEFYLRELSEQTGRQMYNSLDYQVQNLENALQIIQKKDMQDEESLSRYISSMSEIYGFDFYALIDEEGTAYTKDGSILESVVLPKESFDGPKIFVNQIQNFQNMIVIALPIRDLELEGRAIRGGVVGIDTGAVVSRLSLKDDANQIFSNVIQRDGSYIIKTPHSHLADNNNIFSALKTHAKFMEGLSAEKIQEDIQAGRSGITAYYLEGFLHYTYYAPAEGTEWYLTTTMHYDTISADVERVRAVITRNSMILLLLVLAAVLTVFTVYLWQRHRNEILQLEKIQAEERSRAKSVFLSNMSHDIRTPMNAIIGFTDLAIQYESESGDSRIQDYLLKIRAAGSHLLSLINDVLDMSRIESGKMHLDIEPCSISQILNNINTIVQGQIQDKGQNFHMDAEGIQNDGIYCDKLRLNQVILNLLGNAVKFTPAGGTISVTVLQKGRHGEYGSYEFRVKDNGIGMTPEFAKRVFEPFERERTSTVSGIQGTGLGMAITKNIIDLMKGSICVETAPDQGTEFIVHVELKIQEQGEDTPRKENETSSEEPNFSGKRILLVEDNELNREIASEILQQYGFEIEEAEDGAVAVETIKNARPGWYDLILMDIQMPVMDGYMATRTIRGLSDSSYADIPIIAMTANAFEDDKKNALESGMNGHIAKPVDVDALIRILADVLR